MGSNVILRQADKLRDIRDNIEVLIREVLEESATLIEDMIISQLEQGMDGDGNFLPDYSPVSVFKYGKPPGPIKLYDTGDFYRNVFIEVFDNAFVTDDKDPKRDKLVLEFGSAIVKLSEPNKQILIDHILVPELHKKVQKRIAE